ncbi:MAG: S-methyl-5-thioribose-1-phosphate isomerase [Thermoplasmata archaeon]|nr:S-methyl-5-thioribose-1-phosphate isomerase [Thermoplasmata archaeon]
MSVRALWFERGRLFLLDQRRLPSRVVVQGYTQVEHVAEAIRSMVVRGAPSIGVAAAYGMALASRQAGWTSARAARLLGSTRPTANDLFVGIDAVRSAWDHGRDPLEAASEYRDIVVGECHRIGEAGAPLFRTRERVLTHCNAGALATVEWGTALAPLRVAHDRGSPIFVWVDETRPLLQGSRLTAWELEQEGIPHAVIADNAAGHFMRRGEVDAVIVGADRIARNGDFANKVGTYEKAVLARENGIPFYVAAPFSTFDPASADGTAIPVEERSEEELRRMGGSELMPRKSRARNPAFDVTPSRFVTSFITPTGLASPRGLGQVFRARVRATEARSAARGSARARTGRRSTRRSD